MSDSSSLPPDTPRADICLVQMPYAALERPSMALGVLKALLNSTSIRPAVLYPNFDFAQDIGLDAYWSLAVGSLEDLLGEWTFAGAAFPDFEPDHERYLARAEQVASVTYGYKRLLKSRGGSTLHDAFWEIRHKAAGFVDRVAQDVLARQPRIVGCTSTFQQHCASLALLRRVKALSPDVITLMGGANTDSSMGVVTWASFPWVDVVVSGEVEGFFVDLCRRLLEGGCAGLGAAMPAGVLSGERRAQDVARLFESPPRAVLSNLDLSPPPDYSDYFRAIETSPIGEFVRPTINIETSRGCWWGAKHHCTFCGLNGNGMSFRSKSPERAITEFRDLSERYGLRNFFTVDNILDMRYFDRVLPALEASPQKYSIFYEIKANLRREQVHQLARAGVRWVQPGLESMHDEILGRIDKGNTTLINVQLLKWTAEFGIFAAWHFLYGVPGEDDAWYTEMAEWLPSIFHLQPPTGLSRIQIERFSPYQRRPADFGLVLRPHSAYSHVYPLEEEQLRQFAYYFEHTGAEAAARPGFVKLQEAVSAWKRSWFLSQSGRAKPIELAFHNVGGELRIRDTRPLATPRELVLSRLQNVLLVLCDRASTTGDVCRALASQPDSPPHDAGRIAEALEQLTDLRLMLRRKGRYLSLVLPEHRVPYERLYAGGEVQVDRWVLQQRRREQFQRASAPSALDAFTGSPAG